MGAAILSFLPIIPRFFFVTLSVTNMDLEPPSKIYPSNAMEFSIFVRRFVISNGKPGANR